MVRIGVCSVEPSGSATGVLVNLLAHLLAHLWSERKSARDLAARVIFIVGRLYEVKVEQ
jgi:hypothetical protein